MTYRRSDMRLFISAQSTFARAKDLKSSMTWEANVGTQTIHVCLCKLMHCPKDDTTQKMLELYLTQVKLPPVLLLLMLFYFLYLYDLLHTCTNVLSKDHLKSLLLFSECCISTWRRIRKIWRMKKVSSYYSYKHFIANALSTSFETY